jgi:hypothetical protein
MVPLAGTFSNYQRKSKNISDNRDISAFIRLYQR